MLVDVNYIVMIQLILSQGVPHLSIKNPGCIFSKSPVRWLDDLIVSAGKAFRFGESFFQSELLVWMRQCIHRCTIGDTWELNGSLTENKKEFKITFVYNKS